MDTSNPVIQLIIQGTQAEYAKQMDQACHLYRQAWDICKDAYEFTMAAHYVARCQPTTQERLHWNQIALNHAQSIILDPRITAFLPSLYLNLGKSYEETGDFEQSDHYFQLAAAMGFNRQAL